MNSLEREMLLIQYQINRKVSLWVIQFFYSSFRQFAITKKDFNKNILYSAANGVVFGPNDAIKATTNIPQAEM